MKQFSGSKCSTDPPAPPQTDNVKLTNTFKLGHRPDQSGLGATSPY